MDAVPFTLPPVSSSVCVYCSAVHFEVIMLKKSAIAIAVLSVVLSAATSAAVFEANSVGRNEETAVKNVKVRAVRDAMQKMVDQNFIKSHVKEIRTEIIMKSDDFIIGTQISSSTATESGNVNVSASVDVDEKRLAASLLCLGADVNVFYRPSEPAKCNTGESSGSVAETAVATVPVNQDDPVIRPVSPKLFEDSAPFNGTPVTDDMNTAAELMVETMVSAVASAMRPNSGNVTVQRMFKSEDGGVVYELLDNNISFLRMSANTAVNGDTVDTSMKFDEENLKKVLENMPSFLHDMFRHALASFRIRYDPRSDTAKLSYELNGKLNLGKTEFECRNSRQTVTLYDLLARPAMLFDLKNRIDKISVYSQDGKSVHNFYNAVLEVQNRPEVNIVRIGMEKYAGNTGKFGPITIDQPSLEFVSRRAEDGGDNLFDYGIRKRIIAFTGLGMEIRDAELTLGLRNLNLTGLAQLCRSTAENPLTAVSSVQCLTGAVNTPLLADSMKNLFTETSELDLNLKAKLHNQPLEFAASAYLGNINPNERNAFANARIKGYLKVGSGIFSMQQYHLQDMAPYARGFAGDPNAAVYEYEILYADGRLSINGNTVFGQ